MGKKTALIILVFLLSVPLGFNPLAGADTSGLVEMEFDHRTTPAPPVCGFPGLIIPSNAKVVAAGAYQGRPLGWNIDRSGHQATLIQVAVNSPEAPVILMLAAYEPNVWQIGWTEGTKILAVIASGYHSQFVSGPLPETPLVVGSYDQGSRCPRFTISDKIEDIKRLNNLSQELFGRPLDDIVKAEKGEALIGPKTDDKFYTARALSHGDFSLAATPLERETGRLTLSAPALTGPEALREAMRRGQIRPASSQEFSQWAKVRQEAEKRQALADGIPEHLIPKKEYSSGLIGHNAYVVTSSEFVLPEGLGGANSATFFIPPGMPAPSGPIGHCRILFLENGRGLGVGF